MLTYVIGPSKNSTATTADTTTLAEDTIPIHGSGVRALIVNLTGTSHTLGNITRVTVRAGQAPFIDADPAHLRAMVNWHSKSGGEWSTAATRFTIPLHGFMQGGAPRNKRLRLDLAKNATPGAGTVNLHLAVDETRPAPGYPMFITEQQTIPASAQYRGVTITQEGWLVGLTVPVGAQDVQALRLYQGKELLMDLASQAALLEAQQLERGNGVDVSSIVYLRLPEPVPVIEGATRLFLSVGTTADPTIGLHTFVFYPEALEAMRTPAKEAAAEA
jgi:hypothetical protein